MRFVQEKILGPCVLVMALLTYPFSSAGAVGYDFTIEVQDPIKIASLVDLTVFKAVVTNTGDLNDTLMVTMQFEVPDTSWFVQLCVDGVCYPPGVLQAPLYLNSQATDSATVDITAFNVHGGATASLTFRSQGDPNLVDTVHFEMITDGTDVLIVDGDGGSPYETFYKEAVPETYTSGVWDIDLEPVTSSDLAIFDFCFWLTGERVPALTTEEMSTLTEFRGGGGKLFISGQDIGRDVGGTDFYSNYLHASFVTDSTGIFALDGIDGEPISDGLTLQISGGDGANNQVRPSEIAPAGVGAYVSFYYQSTQRAAAVSSVEYLSSDTSRVAYFAFGFEGINSGGDRSTVAQRVIEFLAGIRVGIGGDRDVPGTGPEIPGALVLNQNYPNPFNPSTPIAFRLVDMTRADLSIYDVRGRRVRSLIDRVLPAGEHTFVWDGKNDEGEKVGSGSYFYRLVANEEMITRRMVVAK